MFVDSVPWKIQLRTVEWQIWTWKSSNVTLKWFSVIEIVNKNDLAALKSLTIVWNFIASRKTFALIIQSQPAENGQSKVLIILLQSLFERRKKIMSFVRWFICAINWNDKVK